MSHRTEKTLAAYALRAAHGEERRHAEPAHRFRSPYQRDRDRVIHSRAFRRLAYKTQVFLNGEGDHLRTRMTHTIEVAAIARTIACGLELNEDLTEAVALAHDLGHTPFGHVGERLLNRLLENDGGFDHNRQSLRTVDFLEKKYPAVDGLNLTRAVREGLVKRRGQAARLDGEELPPQPSLEAQVADLADDVAYYAHDVDDGIAYGLLDREQLRSVRFWRLAEERAVEQGGEPDADYFTLFVVRCLIDMLVADVLASSTRELAESAIRTPLQAQQRSEPVVRFSHSFCEGSREFREFLFRNLYWHKDVLQVNYRAEAALQALFEYYEKHPDALGHRTHERLAATGLRRGIADYIAGMTDLYAIEQYRCLLGGRF